MKTIQVVIKFNVSFMHCVSIMLKVNYFLPAIQTKYLSLVYLYFKLPIGKETETLPSINWTQSFRVMCHKKHFFGRKEHFKMSWNIFLNIPKGLRHCKHTNIHIHQSFTPEEKTNIIKLSLYVTALETHFDGIKSHDFLSGDSLWREIAKDLLLVKPLSMCQ